ncbi:MAG TPA: hypothetical protein VF240_19725 [Pyrinomonadaceae bacterium]
METPTVQAAPANVKTGRGAWKTLLGRLAGAPRAREALVILGFFAVTALMTWPWVTRMRDAVGDVGDPYMIAWTLWWDYHQTFNDPLNLFHANVFHPYRYTLAFSENDYGIALLFFPLYALGARPLTVHSVATFCGFVFCGYAAFRLARTLTGSVAAGWVAGVVFAFVPYRFHLLSHLHYLFAGWIPLLLEALVLFARERSWKRAAWLGVAFLMNALTCITWFILTLPALALSAAFLVARYRLARERAFWVRGAAALGLASLALLPFLLPYYHVSRMYNFAWGREEVVKQSPRVSTWLSAETRNRVWRWLGARSDGSPLFPGLLPLLLALAAFTRLGARRGDTAAALEGVAVEKDSATARRAEWWTELLDAAALAAGVLALVAAVFEGTQGWGGTVFGVFTSDRALFVLACALVARLCVAYPLWFRPSGNLIETMRAGRHSDAVWLGALWAAVGFLMSLGTNSLFYRLVYDHLFLFRSQRLPARGAMLAYVGLAVLAGLGAVRVAGWVARRRRDVSAGAVCAVLILALLFELRAAPLRFVRGAVFPDEVTLRLKETPMRGGVVELPAGPDGHNHLYMLRAADHARPLVNATSSFVPQPIWELHELTRGGPIAPRLLDLLEELSTSYVVVHNARLAPERHTDYEQFFARAVATGRLRFVRRFEGRDDLYAVTMFEPEARGEEPLPFVSTMRRLDEMLAEDPVNLLGEFFEWGQTLERLHKASFGRPPRYEEFMPDAQRLAAGVLAGDEDGRTQLENNYRALISDWTRRAAFVSSFGALSDEQFIDALARNAGLSPPADERAALAEALRSGTETRAGVLASLVARREFVERENYPSTVLLHYFGYLRRDPGAPPERDASGFDFWITELEHAGGDRARLGRAFAGSGEYLELRKRLGKQP